MSADTKQERQSAEIEVRGWMGENDVVLKNPAYNALVQLVLWARQSATPPAVVPAVLSEAVCDAINFALNTSEGLEFLRAWQHGDWDVIRKEWPEAPPSVIVESPPVQQAETATRDGALVQGSTVYVLNDRGVNRWAAQVQPGRDENDERTSDAECCAIARRIADALSTPPAVVPAVPSDAVQVLGYVERMLTNLQPHIPQACQPGRQGFIDNYIDPVLERVRAALSQTTQPQAETVPKGWRIEREPRNVLALHRAGTAQPYRFEPGEAVHALLSDLLGGCPECGGSMEYEDGEAWDGPSVGCTECGLVATPPAATPAAPMTRIPRGEADYALMNRIMDLSCKAIHASAKANSDDGHAGTEAMGQYLDLTRELWTLIANKQSEQAAIALPAPVAAPAAPFIHKKTGGKYQFVGNARLQVSVGPLNDMDYMVVYRGEDGKLWVRPSDEFTERFYQEGRPGLLRDDFLAAEQEAVDATGGMLAGVPDTAPAPASEAVATDAARDVLAERQRQINAEGWTPEHDDEHSTGSMAIAAACYALSGLGVHALPAAAWPVRLWGFTGWSSEWWKPKDRRSNLVRSGALILAELERLDRAALQSAPPQVAGKDGAQ